MLAKNNSILRLVKILLGKKKLSVARLSQKLGVTERTVYRHLNTLEDMGWKIGCDNGYFIAPRCKCPMCGKRV
jgi:predicted DNA-binding transcriptional regulator YafY